MGRTIKGMARLRAARLNNRAYSRRHLRLVRGRRTNTKDTETMITIPESYMLLSCGKCGHEADFFDFCHTPIRGDLPSGTHQCPKCRKAWKMEKYEEGQWLASGQYIPPGRRAVSIPTIL